jgi:hypothetical protein
MNGLANSDPFKPHLADAGRSAFRGKQPFNDVVWIPGGTCRPTARMAQEIDTSTCHLGFRCIVRIATGS